MSKKVAIIPNISITGVIIRFNDNKLEVLLEQHSEADKIGSFNWELPRSAIEIGETTMETVQRMFHGSYSFEIGFLDQFRTFSETNCDLKQTGVTIGHCVFVRQKGSRSNDNVLGTGQWFKMNEMPSLIPSHNEILAYSLKYLKILSNTEPIVFDLLPQKFTLLELICLYEQIWRVEIDKSNFRRKILSMNLLVESNEKQQDVSHRAAKFYEFDYKRYREKADSGFSFDL
jgi:hypothetical protein